jgi:hypothetical protein
MDASFGAFEAKAQLSRLLRAVADLVPHRVESAQGVAAAVAALKAFPRIRGVADAEVADFVREGRL